MPYVDQKARKHLDNGIEPLTAGEVNYLITRLIIDYLEGKEKIGYDEMNEVLGILEGVKAEFIRRVMNPYEDVKKMLNGDIGYNKLNRNTTQNNMES